jgi:PTS system nitrogen regulatory IIA component
MRRVGHWEDRFGAGSADGVGAPEWPAPRRAGTLPRLLPPQPMDETEAARLLNVTEATLRRWVRQGLLRPLDGRGRRFDPAELERWARRRGLPLGAATRPRPAPPEDLLAAAVERGAVTAGVRPATASEAIEIAVGALPSMDDRAGRDLLDEVLERERMASTALGHGFALPHPRKPPGDLIDEAMVSVVFPDAPLDWAALDGEPVHTVFLLLSPSAPLHLQILSAVARSLRSPELPDFLRGRPSQARLVAWLRVSQREE